MIADRAAMVRAVAWLAIVGLTIQMVVAADSDVTADVETRAVTIWSDGTRMAGDLYLPRDRTPGQKLPGIVESRWGGSKFFDRLFGSSSRQADTPHAHHAN